MPVAPPEGDTQVKAAFLAYRGARGVKDEKKTLATFRALAEAEAGGLTEILLAKVILLEACKACCKVRRPACHRLPSSHPLLRLCQLPRCAHHLQLPSEIDGEELLLGAAHQALERFVTAVAEHRSLVALCYVLTFLNELADMPGLERRQNQIDRLVTALPLRDLEHMTVKDFAPVSSECLPADE
jgi:hypothetical protein